jgi:hypothetical protein
MGLPIMGLPIMGLLIMGLPIIGRPKPNMPKAAAGADVPIAPPVVSTVQSET